MIKSSLTSLVLVTVTALSVALSSCGGVKPTASGSGKNLYESFYAGDGSIRYFIKPLELKSEDETMLIDFNVVSSENDTAAAIFSILSEGPLKNIERIAFENNTFQKEFNDVEKMFIELEKRHYESRYSAAIPNKDLKAIFADHNWTVKVTASNQTMTFTTKRKAQKKIVTLNKAVFMLVE